MEWITSAQNTKIKLVRALREKKERDRTGLFFLEGKRLVSEVNNADIEYVLVSESYQDMLPSQVDIYKVSEKIFSAIADTKTPQGILAVCRKKEQPIRWTGSFYVLLENMKDPGNVGAMIRTADALGVDGLFLTKGSVDIYNPKVLRSAMGSHFHLPVFTETDISEVVASGQAHGFEFIGAHLAGENILTLGNIFTKPVVLAIGNEAWGLSEQLARACGIKVKIPIFGQAESLNATVAGSILMYEACRQKNIGVSLTQ